MSFQNCKISGARIDPAVYHFRQQPERGKPDYCVSSSMLRKFGFCPLSWRNGKEQPRTSALDYGNLFETILLMPETYTSRFVTRPAKYMTTGMECPKCKSVTDSMKCRECGVPRVSVNIEKDWERKSKVCQELEDEWEKAGKIVVDQDGNDKFPGFNQAREAAKVLWGDRFAGPMIHGSEYQVHVTGEWLDEGTGLVIPCQCLIDLVPPAPARALGDIKTTRCGYEPFFTADMRSKGYHIQGAWNLNMFNAATGEGRDTFALITSDSVHPWTPATYLLTEGTLDAPEGGFIDYGRGIYKAWMAEYAQSVKTGHWRGYTDGWQELQPNQYKDLPAMERAQAHAPTPQAQAQEMESELIP